MKTRPLPFSPLSSRKISGRVRSSILVARQTGWWWSREEIRLWFFSGLKLVRVPGLKYWSDQRIYFLCIATNEPADGENYNFIHQVSCSSHRLAKKWWSFWQKRCQQLPLQGGEDVTLQIYMDKAFLPVWVMVCLIAVLLCMVSMIIKSSSSPSLLKISCLIKTFPSPVSSPGWTWVSWAWIRSYFHHYRISSWAYYYLYNYSHDITIIIMSFLPDWVEDRAEHRHRCWERICHGELFILFSVAKIVVIHTFFRLKFKNLGILLV